MSQDGRDGLTIIAFVGSVFSPYYAWSGRRDPENHCAMNVAVFGRATRFAMTERGRGALARNERSIRIGPSQMGWDGRSLTVELDEIAAPWPTRLRGRVRLHPQAVSDRPIVLEEAGGHHWWPFAPVARVEVTFEAPRVAWSGWGYLDTNWGEVPLEASFRRWDWCRAPLEHGGTAVLYNTTLRTGAERALALQFEPGGAITPFRPPPVAALPQTAWRLPRETRSEAPGRARVLRTVLDAPFYARSEVATTLLGQEVLAIHESLSLDRLKNPMVRCMLPFRMPRALGALRRPRRP